MRKYIIRNCPACYLYDNRYGCENNHDEQGRDTYCELINDCIMKQIYEEAKECQCSKLMNDYFDIQKVE